WKPPAHSPEENMVRQKCSGIRRSYLVDLVQLLEVVLYAVTGAMVCILMAFASSMNQTIMA
ncbi:hypothetical protein CD912_23525, partial [Shigella boydii]